ncbi:hypothetical protein Ddye_012733 [Dipteronia dyeriana]|uniref:E3 ubiquitin-protein ligase listerin n=1 Tax=Dipteronia dyeriana TaxID=168575 RepID=A0AAD9X534_9ROSI|nr:hypothetical protein Ddye_012733 [Dipteronia dyeriana]
MGKQKGDGGGRTKNRPSSSSLAASLLSSGSTAPVALGFGGYVGSSRLDSSLSNEDSSAFLDIDSEVAQHLKRLARKDPTTKLKALASLSVLFKQKSGKDIVLIIPQWAFEYKRLLLDYNREVRRATHETMTNLVTAVGRDLALHLKSLMGPWWFAQFDANSEVSHAAKRSLQAAFPVQEKRLDALILCTSEVFMYLEENLKLTPQNLSDKAVALDELEEMHRQVISSSLLALATLLDVLICEQLGRPGFENITAEPKHASKARTIAVSSAEKLFSAHKYFQDFRKSQSPAIRSATYSVLRTFIKNIPHACNEGNMKTIATSILGAFEENNPVCHSSMWDTILLFSKRFPDSWTLLNVQKTILNRLWNFLRNGCFGTQQISYPAVVLFLEVVPPNAVAADKFFLDFFQSLWAGRNQPHSSNTDQLAFFQAFKECFLWGLCNTSRFCDGAESVSHFQVFLIDNILVKLLWEDLLFCVSSKGQNREISGSSVNPSEDSNLHFHKKTVETLNTKYPLSYFPELGKCVIEILAGIYSLEHKLLSFFCVAFQETCLKLFQQKEIIERRTENIEQIIKFLSLLERHAMQKGEAWPLVYLVGPMLAKSFPLIRSLDSVDGIRLLTVSIHVFGPRKIVQELFADNEECCYSSHSSDRDSDLDSRFFMQVFKETFVPWCLHEYNYPTSARLDLLLTLLDNEYFRDQLCAVISFATNSKYSGPGSLDADRIVILAMLLEKAREKITMRKVGEHSSHQPGSLPDHWHHELLESTAVAISCSFPPFGVSDSRFIRALLGGSREGNQFPFVSRNALITIFKEVLKKLLTFLLESSFTWIRDTGSHLSSVVSDLMLENGNSINVIEMAQFALDLLEGSFFCLKTLDDDSGLVSSISVAVFLIGWEFSMATAIDDTLEDESKEKIKTRLVFCESMNAFRTKINIQFWKSLSIDNQKRLGSMLIHSIRVAIFKEDNLNTEEMVSLCCMWMLEVLDCLGQEQHEKQTLLDQLLSKGDKWPLWISPNFCTPKRSAALNIENTPIEIHAQVSGHHKFVSLIDKLISKVGFDIVVSGYVTRASLSLHEETTHNEVNSRAWLAAEILCTWKWPGGSALGSFLPLLSAYAKNRTSASEQSLLGSIFIILLDGALVHGGSGTKSLHDIWPALGDKVEDIEEPFLRALVSLLLTLFRDNIWEAVKATTLFELLQSKLFIGESVDMNCLSILPLIVSVLIRPLSRRSNGSGECNEDVDPYAVEQNQVQDTIKSWLQRTLLFPPLVTWQTGQDMEEWFQLVISCYPLSATGGTEPLKLERHISHEERTLLINLFRKQRHGAGATIQLPVVQLLLSKLVVISVGYCWKEFDEDDWDFFFTHVGRWTQSAVVMMEEVAENVNDAVAGCSINDLDVNLKKIEEIVFISDPHPINNARNALISFSLCHGLLRCQSAEESDSLRILKTEKWDRVLDRIVEGALRLLFCTGISEAIASSFCLDAASIILSSRHGHLCFWELVASIVLNSSPHLRDRAVKSIEFWGLSKGSISALYAILFSSKPIASLQFAAYAILSSEPISQLAIVSEDTAVCLDSNSSMDQDTSRPDLSSEETVHLKEEISCMIEKLPFQVLEMDLASEQRVNVFLAWSLLLSHLLSLPSTPRRERLVQYILDSANSVIIDCIFQHIPLECLTQGLKKKDGELPTELSAAATAATRSISTGSLLFSVESLWPVEPVKLATLAGAIYGLMLCVLPAYVRGWFTDLRDRSTSPLVESFTRTWCSPPLLANELSQIKKADVADENFLLSVSKSANEVVSTYSKDDSNMDLVIRLPPSYPLRPVDVECVRSLGISELKQRKWIMSMMLFVRNQNGALAEAIRIWKRNFDKEFEGVEECPICYSVIHTTNHSIPRLACKTCKHKFHSACLYKWFSTSHKSSCPLCQSPF